MNPYKAYIIKYIAVGIEDAIYKGVSYTLEFIFYYYDSSILLFKKE